GGVPLIWRDSTTAPSGRRKRSGDADATWTPAEGRRTTAAYGAGLPSARAAPSAATSASGGSGAESCRHRLTWYTSPAAIASRMVSTPLPNPSSSRLDVHASRAGPRQGAPGQGRAGRTDAKRAHTGSPSNGSTTAQVPEPSSAPRSDVRSTRPVSNRPPTTARSAGRSAISRSLRSSLRTLMNFDLTPEQDAFRNVVRDFADNEIAPHADAWDRDHVFPVDTVLAMGRLGLFGLPFPEEYGGAGADFTTFCLAVEELARVDSSMAITLEAGVGLGANPIFRFGTEDQRQRWLPDLCAGRALGGVGLTEPGGGGDAGSSLTK